jgi:hypothetical protein
MNYQKLDAGLAMALNDVQNSAERNLVIFIHTQPAPDAAAAAFLESLGVSGVTSGRNMFTATLSANAVSQLSDQPWVQYLKLSQKLRPVKKR